MPSIRLFALFATRIVGRASLALLALFVGLTPAFAGNQDAVPGELLIGFRASAVPIAKMGPIAPSLGEVVSIQETLRVVRFKLRPNVTEAQAAASLRRRRDVAYVEPNYVVHAVGDPNDPEYAFNQYGPQIVQANLAWDIWVPQLKTVIAILDTGVDYTHPDLTGKFLYNVSGGKPLGYNALDRSLNAQDFNGHGTACAGIAAAGTNNGVGIAGIAGWNPTNPKSQNLIKIMPVKVLDDSGAGSFANVADGIIWATSRGANVISLSLGGSGDSQTLANAVRYALQRNVVIVAAAGNASTDELFYPAAYPDVISVAATDSADTMAYFSNYGSWVKIAAPGLEIYTTDLFGGYTYFSGTSAACPHVAGAAAMIRAQTPSLTGAEISDAILSNVDPYVGFDDPGVPGGLRIIAPGAGRLNVYRALVAAKPIPAFLSTFYLSTSSVSGVASVTGYVRLNKPSLNGGTTIALTYSTTNGLVSPPNSVVVPAGQSRASFTLNTVPANAAAPITIMATTGTVSKTATLTLNAAQLNSVNVNPTTVTGGTACTGSVSLSGNAPQGGVTVTLTSSDPSATVPASVTIPANASSVTFPVDVKPVASSVVVAVTATYNSATKTAHFTVTPPDLTLLTLTPRIVTGGANITGKIVLNGVTAADTTVTLTNTNAAATVPATVIVPAGSDTATFTITTVSPGSSRAFGTVKATLGSVSRVVALTVNP